MKKFLSVCLALILVFSTGAVVFAAQDSSLRLVVPENWELDIGDSRTVESVFSGNTKNRVLNWTADPTSVATVDEWGRVTAKAEGTATITAETTDGLKDSVTLSVKEETTKTATATKVSDYQGEAIEEVGNLQKVVSRYAIDKDKEVPSVVKAGDCYPAAQSAVTADGAKWEITDYGVLRTDENAPTERDVEQRFMGDRYFYDDDTSAGKVLAIFKDGENGIWTVMAGGYTHIAMVEMNGKSKAEVMSDTTQQYVARRGMVSEACLNSDGEWKGNESDNDGLWTSMYGAGEIMRYAVLKNDPTAKRSEIKKAHDIAVQSVEACLLLTYISMRDATTEALVHAQRNGSVNNLDTGKWYGENALVKGGNYSQNVPDGSPAAAFEDMNNKYMLFGIRNNYIMDKDNLCLYDENSWANPTVDTDKTYATRTRLLTGFWSRTYSLKDEGNQVDGYIHWSMNGDGTATGVSTKTKTDNGYLLNGENLRGVTVDASGTIPERLWNDLIGSGYDISDVVYKGDTSADEIIGHLFIYKIAYDILGKEDSELKSMISTTMDKFAQHITDNGYALCDGSGQPTTWGKFSRTYFSNGQVLGGAPLQTAVILSAFKVAAYVTGEEKWENEYRMAALDPDFEYAKIMTQESERYTMSMLEYLNGVSPVLGFMLRPLVNTKLFSTLYRMILNYSDEEMAMLAYYLLFQLEDDEALLSLYREGINDWWKSIQYSENPLWYYIYQLAYPDTEVTDAYGNNLVETAAWSLSRHPIDTIKYSATNSNRTDIAEVDFNDFGIDGLHELSYDPNVYKPWFSSSSSNVLRIAGTVLTITKLQWSVAAPDERALHKYNGSTYVLDDDHNIYEMEGSTTYTLPYWLGRYHNMLKG